MEERTPSLHIVLDILLDFHEGPENHGVIKLQCSRGTQAKTVQGRTRLVIGVHIQKVPLMTAEKASEI